MARAHGQPTEIVGRTRCAAGDGTELASPVATMIRIAIGFFIVAVIAAIFGYGGIASDAAAIAKILFIAFAVIAVLALVVGLVRR